MMTGEDAIDEARARSVRRVDQALGFTGDRSALQVSLQSVFQLANQFHQDQRAVSSTTPAAGDGPTSHPGAGQ